MRSMPPGRSPNGACSFGEVSWGWTGNGFPTTIERPFRSLFSGELSCLLRRVLAPAPCTHTLEKIPQHFVDSKPARCRRGLGRLLRLTFGVVVLEQCCLVVSDRSRVLPNIAGVVYAARQLAEVFRLDSL